MKCRVGSASTKMIAQAGIIAALYMVLSFVSAAFVLSQGNIQVRLSEALCVLPIFIPAAIPGITIGCLLSNILTGCILWDVIFGTLATLIGAVGTFVLRKNPLLAQCAPIVSNSVIIPFILYYGYGINIPIWTMMLTVGLGEVVSIGVLGRVLYVGLKKIDFGKV